MEGNIGCGKSTMMEYFKNCSDSVEVVPEPLEKWTNLNGHNALVSSAFQQSSSYLCIKLL